MPIKRYPPWHPLSWPEVPGDPPTVPLPRVVALDDPDPLTPLFDSVWAYHGLSGRHAFTPTREVPMGGAHYDRDGDGRADHWDRQSLAFRENTDHVPDAVLAEHAEKVHEPLSDLAEIRLPDGWEAFQWDRDRDGPKTLTEARVALAERIADPAAPDDTRVAGAYDGTT